LDDKAAPQHDSEGKILPDPGEKRGSRMRSLRTSTRKVMKISDRIYGKKHGLTNGIYRVCATRHQTIIVFGTTSAQGDLSWFSGQAMGVYKLCMCNFKDEHTRARKH
jgi:hypothetical protein